VKAHLVGLAGFGQGTKYIFVGYGDGVKGCRLWDPTTHKIIISRDMYMEQSRSCSGSQREICLQTQGIIVWPKVTRQWYKMFDSFMVSQSFLRSEYDHCVYGIFIILVLC
jgi:hypothetical protein